MWVILCDRMFVTLLKNLSKDHILFSSHSRRPANSWVTSGWSELSLNESKIIRFTSLSVKYLLSRHDLGSVRLHSISPFSEFWTPHIIPEAFPVVILYLENNRHIDHNLSPDSHHVFVFSTAKWSERKNTGRDVIKGYSDTPKIYIGFERLAGRLSENCSFVHIWMLSELSLRQEYISGPYTKYSSVPYKDINCWSSSSSRAAPKSVSLKIGVWSSATNFMIFPGFKSRWIIFMSLKCFIPAAVRQWSLQMINSGQWHSYLSAWAPEETLSLRAHSNWWDRPECWRDCRRCTTPLPTPCDGSRSASYKAIAINSHSSLASQSHLFLDG